MLILDREQLHARTLSVGSSTQVNYQTGRESLSLQKPYHK